MLTFDVLLNVYLVQAKVTGLGPGSQGLGAQRLGPGFQGLGALKSPDKRQAKGWETAETAAAEVGAWREAGTGYPL